MNNKKQRIFKIKYYAHFDNKIHWSKVKNIVITPEKVAKHGFYPFIHYTKKTIKFDSKEGRKPPKERGIFYSSHIDRYIYQYYAYKLNYIYNIWAIKNGINRCSIAYRNNLHKCNIHFAKEVFDFIRKHDQVYIIIGDFKNFFDSLDHYYLKRRLCDLLNMNSLPQDYYAVFKSITRYSFFELDSLLDINNLKYKELNKKERVLDLKDFRKYKKKYLKKNEEDYGIPQGSSISAVLSNIYMMIFDKEMNDLITSNNGIYRRYSDDFIIAVPQCNKEKLYDLWKSIESAICSIKNLELQKEKTKVFEYKQNQIRNCNNILFPYINNGKNIIDYLGFSFDGKVITIRDKTITKYYYRMYRKIDTIVKSNFVTWKGNKIPKSTLYKKYSFYGVKATKKHRGNFLTYVNRAMKVFGPGEAIDRCTKRHWGKLQKRLHVRKS